MCSEDLLSALKHTANPPKPDIQENTTATKFKTPRNFSAQAAYSSVDVSDVSITESLKKTLRHTKSEDEVQTSKTSLTKNEILEWFKEEYNWNQFNEWSERLLKVAKKASTPEGEDILRNKINKYLSDVSSQFSEEGRRVKRLRENLPDDIIRLLKSIHSKSKHYKQPIKTYLPTAFRSNDIIRDFSGVVTHWFRKVKLGEDWLDVPIDRDAICDSLICKLKHYMNSKRYYHIIDFKSTLKSFLMKFLNYLPIDANDVEKRKYVTRLADDLVMQLTRFYNSSRRSHYNNNVLCKNYAAKFNKNYGCFYSNINKNVCENNPTLRAIKDFVVEEIIKCVERMKVILSRRRLISVKLALTELFVDGLKSESIKKSRLRSEIEFNLQNICKLSKSQASHFSKEMCVRFLNKFYYDTRISRESITSQNYRVVSYQDKQLKRKKEKQRSNIDMYYDKYTNEVEKEIDKWLDDLDIKAPLIHQYSYRKMAISDLAREIVKNEMIQKGDQPNGDEIFDIRLRIIRWIIKLTRDDNLDILGPTTDLIRRIKNVSKSTIGMIEPRLVKEEQKPREGSDLYEVIFNWLQGLPYELLSVVNETFVKHATRDFAQIIEKNNSNKNDIDKTLQFETDVWLKTILKNNPKPCKIAKLKEKIKSLLKTKNDPNMQDTKNNTEYVEQCYNGSKCNVFDLYLKDVAKEVNAWLDTLNIPCLSKTKRKNVAVYDLAGDIVDRYKYLQLNPSYIGTYEDDLEYLKFQIFKSINKVVGFDNLKTIEQAPKLMEKITALSAPSFTKSKIDTKPNKDDINGCLYDVSHCDCEENTKIKANGDANNAKTTFIEISKPNEIVFGDNEQSDKHLNSNINLERKNCECACILDKETNGKNEASRNVLLGSKYCNKNEMNYSKNGEVNVCHHSLIDTWFDSPDQHCSDEESTVHPINTSILGDVLEVSTLEEAPKDIYQTYRYFDTFFKQYCDELPSKSSTPRGIYNGIWKLFFKLKSDPRIENDIDLFRHLFEDRLDTMLDCLPQTTEFKQNRQKWKTKVVYYMSNMLIRVQNIKYASEHLIKHKKDNFVLSTSVQNSSTKCRKATLSCRNSNKNIKACLEDMHNKDTNERYKKTCNFDVDFQEKNLSEKEAEIAKTIEQWYSKLPMKTVQNKFDETARKKIRELLARKIHRIESETHVNITAEEEIRCTIVRFLANDAELDINTDINLNDIVDNLMMKLETRRDAPLKRKRKILNRTNNSSTKTVPSNRIIDRNMGHIDDHSYVTQDVVPNFIEHDHSLPITMLQPCCEAKFSQSSFVNARKSVDDEDQYNTSDDGYDSKEYLPCDSYLDSDYKYMKRFRSFQSGES